MKLPGIIILLFIAGLVMSCKKSSGIEGGHILNPAVSKTFLALGDSYTVGQGVDASQSFPVQTKFLLQASGLNVEQPQIVATTGWTTTNLLNAIQAGNFNPPYDIVTLLAGVNDQFQTRDTTGYRDRFDQLITKSVMFAGGRPDHVFILSIPDYSVTPFASGYDTVRIRIQIDQFNQINKEQAMLRGCKYLDITASSREARYDPSLLAPDGLHPSGKEYAKWAARLAPLIRTVVN